MRAKVAHVVLLDTRGTVQAMLPENSAGGRGMQQQGPQRGLPLIERTRLNGCITTRVVDGSVNHICAQVTVSATGWNSLYPP